MNVITRVVGQDTIYAKMTALGQKIGAILDPVYTIGYSTPYAIYVHEDLTAYHPTGQAKFIETVVRERAGDLYMQVAAGLILGESLGEAVRRAAEWLLNQSKSLVPVRTGALRASGFYAVGY